MVDFVSYFGFTSDTRKPSYVDFVATGWALVKNFLRHVVPSMGDSLVNYLTTVNIIINFSRFLRRSRRKSVPRPILHLRRQSGFRMANSVGDSQLGRAALLECADTVGTAVFCFQFLVFSGTPVVSGIPAVSGRWVEAASGGVDSVRQTRCWGRVSTVGEGWFCRGALRGRSPCTREAACGRPPRI